MPVPLAARLREATRSLHTEVERAGLMRRMLRGQVDRPGYCALLRNLHPIYEALEAGLLRHRGHRALAGLVSMPMFRADALADDLGVLQGPHWQQEIAIVPAAEHYVGRLSALSDTAPALLAAHAYVRYLGDLSGGQMLVRLVGRQLGLTGPDGLRFYDFGATDDVARHAAGLRITLDQVAPDETAAQALVDEACSAFVRHRALFEQLEPRPQPIDAG